MKNEFISHSTTETEEIAYQFSKMLKKSDFVALFGDLGVGKTAFVRGLAKELCPDVTVKSPTYTIVNEYRKNGKEFFHFDVYRIEDEDELYSIGFYDYADRRGVCLTEWSENIEYALPEQYIRVEISKNDASNTDSRSIAISLI